MLHAAHEGREPALVACTPPFAAEPPNNEFFVFAVEKSPPRKCSRFSGVDRFGPCRLHADIYEPIVCYLGMAEELSSAGAPSARLAVAHLNLKLSRLSWSTDRQPISFMSRSISAYRFLRALSTPA